MPSGFHVSRRSLLIGFAVAFFAALAAGLGSGQALLGATIQSSLNLMEGVGGVLSGLSLRELVVKVLRNAVSYLALLGVVAFVVAGIVLMAGMGSDTAVQRGRKIIIFTVVGLLIVFFARLIILFIQSLPV